MHKKTLIVGDGWLGNIIKDYLKADMFEGRLNQLTTDSLKGYDVLINCAAKTDIDWCEKNKIQALYDNSFDARHAAAVCAAAKVKYVFISSACIFESKDENDWKNEESHPNPGCFYALTKWVAEELIKEINPDSLIVRIRLPFSEKPHKRNTITKISKYKELQTNQESVTVIEDMLPELKTLIEEDFVGVVHLINSGTISPHEIGDLLGRDHEAIYKKKMDIKMMEEGRARRVTTLVRSTRWPYLPPIRNRIVSLLETYEKSA